MNSITKFMLSSTWNYSTFGLSAASFATDEGVLPETSSLEREIIVIII